MHTCAGARFAIFPLCHLSQCSSDSWNLLHKALDGSMPLQESYRAHFQEFVTRHIQLILGTPKGLTPLGTICGKCYSGVQSSKGVSDPRTFVIFDVERSMP